MEVLVQTNVFALTCAVFAYLIIGCVIPYVKVFWLMHIGILQSLQLQLLLIECTDTH